MWAQGGVIVTISLGLSEFTAGSSNCSGFKWMTSLTLMAGQTNEGTAWNINNGITKRWWCWLLHVGTWSTVSLLVPAWCLTLWYPRSSYRTPHLLFLWHPQSTRTRNINTQFLYTLVSKFAKNNKISKSWIKYNHFTMGGKSWIVNFSTGLWGWNSEDSLVWLINTGFHNLLRTYIHGWGVLKKSRKIELPWILMVPQYLV